MKLPLYQLDAFTDRLFAGNPAAVCPLPRWLPDATMQAIAAENNLSETAFLVAEGVDFGLRWFTPEVEVDLCGHATLAAAKVVLERLRPGAASVRFRSQSGPLAVARARDAANAADWLELDFPARPAAPSDAPAARLAALRAGLGGAPLEVRSSVRDHLVVYGSEAEVAALRPDSAALAELGRAGFIATAPGAECDFVSRFFAPAFGIDEDPVTGSAHCVLAPYWAQRLGKRVLSARQISRRGGVLRCEL